MQNQDVTQASTPAAGDELSQRTPHSRTKAPGAGRRAVSPFAGRLLSGVVALACAAGVVAYVMTDAPANVLSAQELAAISKLDAIKSVQGNGTRVVHIFASVDCSFCRKQEPELAAVRDVTVYLHVLPGHSEGARAMAQNVMCSPNPVQAWARAIGGESVAKAECAGGALERNYALAKQIGVTGTPAFVFPNGEVVSSLLDRAAIERHLALR